MKSRFKKEFAKFTMPTVTLPLQELPPDSEYVVAREDGDLYVQGKKIRFWGGIGGFPPHTPQDHEDPHLGNKLLMTRIKAYGFNMWRIWRYPATIWECDGEYTPGDGSRMDRYDHMIALAKLNGVRLWMGGAGVGGTALPHDVDVIDDPSTAEAWRDAVAQIIDKRRNSVNLVNCVASAWDPRLEAILKRNASKYLSHVNKYTGLRAADDPVFAIWELVNEQWWIVKMISGAWMKLPKFFKDSLLTKWHEYLKDKYGSQEKLVSVWGGLKPGEDLEAGTIYLAPLRGESGPAALNDANTHAMDTFISEKTEFGRDDFSIKRGSDINEFFAGLLLSHKQRLADAFKQNGKATQLSPLLWDTGIGYNGICQLLHQSADAVSHCTYIGGWTHDKTHHRYPWYSGLEEQPRLGQNVPWVEHNTVEGKPYFVYETQIGAPAKYRAEYPYRLVFLAALQGWDCICWHSMSGGYRWDKEEHPDALDARLDQPGQSASQFHYKNDEVQLSAMHAAGQMFINSHFEKAPNPTKFIYGRRTLFHPDSMDYAGSYGKMGLDMMSTAFRYGSRIEIDPTREDDEIQGPTIPLRGFAYPNPVMPTDQMIYNWNKGFLTFDSPASAAFVGFLSGYGKNKIEFKNGVTISNMKIQSDANMEHGVTQEEGYVAIGIVSTDSDAHSLAEARTAVVSAVSTSHNTGLKVGPDPEGPERPKQAWALMKVFDNGSMPILYSRVGCIITSKHIVGMKYTIRDWHWKVIRKGKIGDTGRLTIKASEPAFLIQLER